MGGRSWSFPWFYTEEKWRGRGCLLAGSLTLTGQCSDQIIWAVFLILLPGIFVYLIRTARTSCTVPGHNYLTNRKITIAPSL